MLKILIIDDEDLKYEEIQKSLNKACRCNIDRAKSRNTGLLFIKESYEDNEPYDLVVCDNYMPRYDTDYKKEPFAVDIVGKIRRSGHNDLQICVCSSIPVTMCELNYFVLYDYSVEMDKRFKSIIDNVIEVVKHD